MLLAGPGRPGVGFQAEVIGLTDSATGFQGRSVWTDERGDQVFSELKGEGTAAKNRIAGTILSGTGRYAGMTGSGAFSWQWVMEGEDGAVQGGATDLKGRVQLGPAEGRLAPMTTGLRISARHPSRWRSASGSSRFRLDSRRPPGTCLPSSPRRSPRC